MFRAMIIGLIVALGSVSVAEAQTRGRVLWTVSGAGAGFGVGLWAGLSAFDDAVNSDRKVWTSAIVGAGVGAVAGFLIARSRRDHTHPSTTASAIERSRQDAMERRSLERLAKSFRFYDDRHSALRSIGEDNPVGSQSVFEGGNIRMSGPDEHEDDLEPEVIEGVEIETEKYTEDEDQEGPLTADVADDDQEGDADDTL